MADARMPANDTIVIHGEVADALRNGTPVVALESAVTTAGLPRSPLPPDILERLRHALPEAFEPWKTDNPINLELARALERVVRSGGAVPATTAVFDGALHIGINDEQLVRLATETKATKTSVADLALHITTGRVAGTTVAATLDACIAAGHALNTAPIRVFATGGIGGVHRGWNDLPDVSADLRSLAGSPVAVVSAGAKSILDIPATMEWLQTSSVLTIGLGTDRFPRFYAAGEPNGPAIERLDDLAAVARLCSTHWDHLHRNSAILVANPVPVSLALDGDWIDGIIEQAEAEARTSGISGAERTPFLLAAVARETEGESLAANLGLLASNADAAARLAVELSRVTHTQDHA